MENRSGERSAPRLPHDAPKIASCIPMAPPERPDEPLPASPRPFQTSPRRFGDRPHPLETSPRRHRNVGNGVRRPATQPPLPNSTATPHHPRQPHRAKAANRSHSLGAFSLGACNLKAYIHVSLMEACTRSTKLVSTKAYKLEALSRVLCSTTAAQLKCNGCGHRKNYFVKLTRGFRSTTIVMQLARWPCGAPQGMTDQIWFWDIPRRPQAAFKSSRDIPRCPPQIKYFLHTKSSGNHWIVLRILTVDGKN